MHQKPPACHMHGPVYILNSLTAAQCVDVVEHELTCASFIVDRTS
jgi:hypothetical protein